MITFQEKAAQPMCSLVVLNSAGPVGSGYANSSPVCVITGIVCRAAALAFFSARTTSSAARIGKSEMRDAFGARASCIWYCATRWLLSTRSRSHGSHSPWCSSALASRSLCPACIASAVLLLTLARSQPPAARAPDHWSQPRWRVTSSCRPSLLTLRRALYAQSLLNERFWAHSGGERESKVMAVLARDRSTLYKSRTKCFARPTGEGLRRRACDGGAHIMELRSTLTAASLRQYVTPPFAAARSGSRYHAWEQQHARQISRPALPRRTVDLSWDAAGALRADLKGSEVMTNEWNAEQFAACDALGVSP